MTKSNPVQARWQIAGDFTHIPRRMPAMAMATANARTELSPRTPRMASILITLFPTPACQLRQLVQFFIGENLCIHHTDDQFFDRTPTETIDYLPDGSGRQPAGRLSGAVNVGTIPAFVRQIPLLFQSAQNGPHAGFLEFAGWNEGLVNGLYRRRSASPDYLHNVVFQICQQRTNSRLRSAT